MTRYTDQESFEKANMFGTGAPNDAYAQHFTGRSFNNLLAAPSDEVPVGFANITFEPGCRNDWHRHDATSGGGQVLICTAGEGWYQIEGEDAVALKEGDVAVIPPNTKHWHGARADSWFGHVAFILPGTDQANVWLEPVSDEDYVGLED